MGRVLSIKFYTRLIEPAVREGVVDCLFPASGPVIDNIVFIRPTPKKRSTIYTLSPKTHCWLIDDQRTTADRYSFITASVNVHTTSIISHQIGCRLAG